MMSENINERIIKISELNAKTENEIKKIAYSDVYLVPCKETIQDEEVKFEYDLEGLTSSENIKKCRIVEKIRFLLNTISIFNLADEYKIDLNSNNIYYDYNFNVRLKDRDINLKEEVVNEEDLILQFKSLIGFVFSKEYTYEDFYKGGIDLLSKNSRTKKYLDLKEIEEIREELLNDLREKEIEDREKLVEVTKKDFKMKKYLIYGMSSMLAVLVTYTVFSSVFLIPLKNNIIKADNYFAQQKYEDVINSLENTRGMKLDKDAKYKLAYSYAISENLSDAQKNNVLAAIKYNSDENILDFWIALGKSEIEDAIDLAKKLQNKQYTLFSIIKKKRNVENDSKMSGEEKDKLLSELETQIEALEKEIKESSENTSEKESESIIEPETSNTNSTTTGNTTDAVSTNETKLELNLGN